MDEHVLARGEALHEVTDAVEGITRAARAPAPCQAELLAHPVCGDGGLLIVAIAFPDPRTADPGKTPYLQGLVAGAPYDPQEMQGARFWVSLLSGGSGREST